MGTWREGTAVALWHGGVRTHLPSPDPRTFNKKTHPNPPAARFDPPQAQSASRHSLGIEGIGKVIGALLGAD